MLWYADIMIDAYVIVCVSKSDDVMSLIKGSLSNDDDNAEDDAK